jgi:hypothetical protein
MTIRETLARAFRALTPEQQANLRWHKEQGTPVLTGMICETHYWSRGGVG